MSYRDRLELPCQGCTSEALTLTPEQAQQVAANPYNHIWWCQYCVQEGAHIDPDFYAGEDS